MSRLVGEVPLVFTAGVDLFAEAIETQGAQVHRVDWRPPMPGTETDLARVMSDRRRVAANAEALRRITSTEAYLVDVLPAGETIGIAKNVFLHAGPPIGWDRASGPLRGALMGAAALEGVVAHPDDAVALFESGSGYTLDPCHHHATVGPMAGVVSASMWVFVIEEPATGGRTYCTLNEGLGKVLRYGAYSPDVLTRLRWMSEVLAPLMQTAVRSHGPIDLKAILAQMLQMGDEAHNRNRAGTLMLLRELLPAMIDSGAPASEIAESVRFVGANDHFFLNLAMPACKLTLDSARGIAGSAVVVAMARNGTDFGIQVAGTGDDWFTGPPPPADVLFHGEYGPDDANPDIGDSAITETAGLCGFAMAAAPEIVRYVGGQVSDALAASRRMYEITVGEHPMYSIPVLDFRGTPTGIDVTKVVRTGILPQINTGMAGKIAGVGQVGAGLVTPPAEIFSKALAALAAQV
jgi:hypothetical protein